MTKKIYFEAAGRIFGAHEEPLDYSPEGYEFVINQSLWEKSLIITPCLMALYKGALKRS